MSVAQSILCIIGIETAFKHADPQHWPFGNKISEEELRDVVHECNKTLIEAGEMPASLNKITGHRLKAKPRLDELDLNTKYSFQTDPGGRHNPCSVAEFLSSKYATEVIISIDSGIGPDCKKVFGCYD